MDYATLLLQCRVLPLVLEKILGNPKARSIYREYKEEIIFFETCLLRIANKLC